MEGDSGTELGWWCQGAFRSVPRDKDGNKNVLILRFNESRISVGFVSLHIQGSVQGMSFANHELKGFLSSPVNH